MIVANIRDGRIILAGSPRYKDLVKSVPGVRYQVAAGKKLGEGLWTAPLTWGTCLALRSVLGEMLQVGSDLAEWATGERRRIESITALKAAPPTPIAAEPRLYPFQTTGVRFLYASERSILGDDVGAGKTPQTIVALKLIAQHNGLNGPVLVVCTKSMTHKWVEEFGVWWPEASVSVVGGTPTQRAKALAPGYDVYVIGWALLSKHSRLGTYPGKRNTEKENEAKELQALAPDAVVLDEAHKILDPKTAQTRAAWAVGHAATYRFGLTATQVANSPEEIWGLGHFVAPEEYPSRSAFIDRYALAGNNVWGGLEIYGLNPKTRDEFFSFFDARFLRRTKEEVLPDLPDKVYSTRYVEMDAKQAKAYAQMEEHGLVAGEDAILVAADPLTRNTRLIQCAAATPVISADGEVTALSAPSCKTAALLDILDEAPGEPLVVFAASRKLIDLTAHTLDKAKVSYVRITGDENAAERSYNVSQFQAGEVQVILCTTGAGSEGITLTRARRMVFLQRSWRHIENLQAEGRIDRIGQEASSIEYIDVITLGTVEHSVHEAGAWKSEKLQEIRRDPNPIRRAA